MGSASLRMLHVAALPFPSPQGTQGLIHSMLSALVEAGHEVRLVCCGPAAFPRVAPYTVQRIEGLFAPSFRSGPSLTKLWLDGRLVRALPAIARDFRPHAVITHHVEASLAALAARLHPVLFLAHTSLRAELDSYFPRALGPACRRLGGELDRFLMRRVQRTLTVSPLLAQLLERESGGAAYPLAIPWEVAAPTLPEERHAARLRLQLQPRDQVVLYAGNLDGYQGLSLLFQALQGAKRVLPHVRLLLATQAPLGPSVRRQLRERGLCSHVQLASLADESDRRAVHAAADVVVVPRGSPGGIPIKLLDALARGAPVIATRRASAGFAMDGVCRLVPDDDPLALQAALEAHFTSAPLCADHGPAYVGRCHAPAPFAQQFTAHVHAACAGAPHPQGNEPGLFSTPDRRVIWSVVPRPGGMRSKR